ncbi:beta-galactosidase-1-like protein 2 [Grus japonensis]|uniref:Beta-galactosidase-1-like protein 2 n=1 Tax=Grus japonensis TaxID=30415 RepID=A0ABC9XQ21_GRUJA
MWPCGGRRQRRLGGVAFVIFVLWLLLRRFNWSELIPLQLWGRTLGLQTENSQFLLEGMPFRIFGGSMHYFRVPREYWEDRMLKMKACGLNTLTTYVPWNLHEQERGKFDFSRNLDLEYVYKKGGPIIAVQVENEYGSYAKDPNYMTYIKMALLNRGIVELLMTSDNKNGLSFGLVEGALATVNFQKLEPGLLKYLDTVQRDQPKMVMEYWTGWFDNWGGPHYVFDADEMVNTVASILKLGASINLYMFHGGTNFGFMNGALEADEYKSDVTSYDYDAVLTEAGDYTSKFFKLRQLFSMIIGQPLPLPPMIESKASYGAILLHQYISLWDVLPSLLQPIKSEFPINMENLHLNDSSGQSYGYVLYETVIFGGGHLHSRDHVRDRAQVFVNTMYVGELDYNTVELSLPEGQGFRQLRLLVENRGRVNYGLALNEQRKGLIGDVFLNKTPLRNFKIYSLEMKPGFMKSLPLILEKENYFEGVEVFSSWQGWEKGVVFVNGQNLGRYWKIGPQETLYLPGPWLWKGSNEGLQTEVNLEG